MDHYYFNGRVSYKKESAKNDGINFFYDSSHGKIYEHNPNENSKNTTNLIHTNRFLNDHENRKLTEIVWHEMVSNIDNLLMKHLLFIHVNKSNDVNDKINGIVKSVSSFYFFIYYWDVAYLMKRYPEISVENLQEISEYCKENYIFYLDLSFVVNQFLIHKSKTVFRKLNFDIRNKSSFSNFYQFLKSWNSHTQYHYITLTYPNYCPKTKSSIELNDDIGHFEEEIRNHMKTKYFVPNYGSVIPSLNELKIAYKNYEHDSFILIIPYLLYPYVYRRLKEFMRFGNHFQDRKEPDEPEEPEDEKDEEVKSEISDFIKYLTHPLVQYFQHVYVINLERREDRKRRFEKFEPYSFQFQFFKACDPIYDTKWAIEYDQYCSSPIGTQSISEVINRKLIDEKYEEYEEHEKHEEHKNPEKDTVIMSMSTQTIEEMIEQDDTILHLNEEKEEEMYKSMQKKKTEQMKHRFIVNFKRYNRKHLSEGEYGVFQSNLQLFELAMKHKFPYIVILEDDVCFCHDFEKTFESLLPLVPSDWNILSLGTKNFHRYDILKNTKRMTPVRFITTYMTGAHAIIYRLDAIELLYEYYKKNMFYPIDEVIKLAIFYNKELRAYAFSESLIIQMCGENTISDIQPSNKNKNDTYEKFGYNKSKYNIVL